MKNNILFLICMLLCPLGKTFARVETPEWQSQYAIGLNKLAPHAYVWPYKEGDINSVRAQDYEQSPYYMSLNGTWKFNWVRNPDKRPVNFYRPDFYTGGWNDIQVPGNWECQNYGIPIYVNETYEFDDPMFHFKKNPPFVPYEDNEVGSYRRTFVLPESWIGRRIVLCFEGVTSFYYVWLNGELLGYNQDSKTPAEWDITNKVKQGENTLAVEVYRWSAGAYLECQDMWRLSGIERDVYLYSTPEEYIADYKVVSPLDKNLYKDGEFSLDVHIGGLKGRHGITVHYGLFDADHRMVAQDGGSPVRDSIVSFDAIIPDVKPWNAEHPYLYTLVVDLKDEQGQVIETTGCPVGFKTSEIKNGRFCINAEKLKGAYMLLDEASVTGTANIVMAAVLAEGVTTIYNAACEPYLQQLCRMLNRMGAKISGIASNLLTIEGVSSLKGCSHRVLPDMIEVGSFIGMAAMTGSEITIKDVSYENLGIIPDSFRRLGIRLEQRGDDIFVPAQEHYQIESFIDGSIMTIADAPWPGLTPDLLSVMLVVATQAKGSVLIHQKMFESRLFFVDKLIDMGAQIILCDPHRAVVIGHDRNFCLRGGNMTSPDIRAGIALLIAALGAEGNSRIHNIEQIDRGYQNIEQRLTALGARITRIE